MANSKEDGASNKGTSIEKMTEGFILSSATNNNSNNNSNDTTITSSSNATSTSIDTPRSITSSPEEGDDSKIVGSDLDSGLEVGVDGTADGGDNSKVTTLDTKSNAMLHEDGKEPIESTADVKMDSIAPNKPTATGGIQISLSLQNKKRKRKLSNKTGSNSLASFTDNDESKQGKKLKLLELDGLSADTDTAADDTAVDDSSKMKDDNRSSNSTVISISLPNSSSDWVKMQEEQSVAPAGRAADENKLKAEANKKSPTISNAKEEQEDTTTNSSIHSNAIPPERVMSPMPQIEDNINDGIRKRRLLSHSPNEGQSLSISNDEGGQGLAVAVGQSKKRGAPALSPQQQQQGTVGGALRQGTIQKQQQQMHNNRQFQNANNNEGTVPVQQQMNNSQQIQKQQAYVQHSQHPQHSHHPQHPQQQQQHTQPSSTTTTGWRVKLYRLNIDGTWDDCGTGRITFYFARSPTKSSSGSPPTTKSSAASGKPEGNKAADGNKEGENKQRNIFRELGEPMLCMRSEELPNDTNNNPQTPQNQNTPQKVLLRTRVLLHDTAYQCQGGNIITWCEPFNTTSSSDGHSGNEKGGEGKGEGKSSSPQGKAGKGGVDLALSFQDNAGCKDIWEHISSVQCRAREVASQSTTWGGLSAGDQGGSGGQSQQQPASAAAGQQQHNYQQHHSHQPLSPKNNASPPTHTYHNTNSPNSPDHDALEDRQLGLVPGPPLGGVRTPITRDEGGGGSSLGSVTDQQHRLHVHDHGANKDGDGSGGSAAEANVSADDMVAISMAAAAAASYGVASGDSNDEIHHNLFSDENEENVLQPIMIPGENNTHQHQQQQGGMPPLQYEQHPSPSDNANNSHNAAMLNMLKSNLPSQPTWSDLPPIMNFITSFHYSGPGGGGGGLASMFGNHTNQLQREELLIYLANDDCAYFRGLLLLHDEEPPAEEDDDANKEEGDGGTAAKEGESNAKNEPDMDELPSDPLASLVSSQPLSPAPAAATQHQYSPSSYKAILATIIKSILLLNDPEIIEYVTSDAVIFEYVVGIMEYDPDLVVKAEYIKYLRNELKFRTVIQMGNGGSGDDQPMAEGNNNDEGPQPQPQAVVEEELLGAIHRLFRVNYLRDNILRPTMDESSLSTLSSLGQFTASDIIRGVVQPGARAGEESYLFRIIKLLGEEIDLGGVSADDAAPAASLPEDSTTEEAAEEEKLTPPPKRGGQNQPQQEQEEEFYTPRQSPPMPGQSPPPEAPADPSNDTPPSTCIKWEQHLAPQDDSIPSRRIRRKGCLLFLNELFNMARSSLQQHEKDDFIENTVNMNVLPPQDTRKATLLSYLSAVLSHPTTDDKERGAALDILGTITMHDPSLLRRYCLNFYSSLGDSAVIDNMRPDPNDIQEVLFTVPPDDLLFSLLFIMATESDAGLLLQASEIIRIVLDTEMGENEHEQGIEFASGGFLDDENNSNAANNNNNSSGDGGGVSAAESEQNSFLALFYDRYIQWLVVPFQYKIAVLSISSSNTSLFNQARQGFKERTAATASAHSSLIKTIDPCPVRSSFALEILSFGVRAHVHRMKFYLIKSHILGTILKMLRQKKVPHQPPGIRCLKLAMLKLLRAVLSVKEEFYHRHVVTYNLFAPVFDLYRVEATGVGNNLITSSILEMCDFICQENIKSLIDYIVTKHLTKKTALSAVDDSTKMPSLDNIFINVETFNQLQKAYEENRRVEQGILGSHQDSEATTNMNGSHDGGGGGLLLMNGGPRLLSKRALEDQRKYRQADEEDSYFNEEDDDEPTPTDPIEAVNVPSPPPPEPKQDKEEDSFSIFD